MAVNTSVARMASIIEAINLEKSTERIKSHEEFKGLPIKGFYRPLQNGKFGTELFLDKIVFKKHPVLSNKIFEVQEFDDNLLRLTARRSVKDVIGILLRYEDLEVANPEEKYS